MLSLGNVNDPILSETAKWSKDKMSNLTKSFKTDPSIPTALFASLIATGMTIGVCGKNSFEYSKRAFFHCSFKDLISSISSAVAMIVLTIISPILFVVMAIFTIRNINDLKAMNEADKQAEESAKYVQFARTNLNLDPDYT